MTPKRVLTRRRYLLLRFWLEIEHLLAKCAGLPSNRYWTRRARKRRKGQFGAES
jgi:hypothetical protein